MGGKRYYRGNTTSFHVPTTPAAMPSQSSASTPARHRLILGIDYGTTFSGVSYVTTDKTNLDDISIITSWPGELSTSWKTPTVVAYPQENRNMDTILVGFEVNPKHLAYRWTKLLLDGKAAAGEFDDPTLKKLNGGESLLQLPSFRDAPGVCEDFLKQLCEYTFDKLRRQMGPTTFDRTPMECWITLPALWSEEAKDATLQAAKNAGFGSRPGDEIYTIAEPEAAAIAALKKFSDPTMVNAVESGEHILICDCGGGTVDITTYTILTVKPQLTFDELCVGVGGKCGSTYIDRNLHLLLSKRFGKSFDDIPHHLKGPGSRFMSCFEKVKRSFGLNDNKGVRELYPLSMKVPDSDFYDVEERTVKLSYEDMRSLFDPVVLEITKLVNQQIQEARVRKHAAINRIILVGGFGDSPYLNKELSEWCSRRGVIELMCPENPQSAVVRGAAIRGLENISPRTRQARRHFGYSVSATFREGVDSESDSWFDDFDERKMCSNRMHWVIAEGEDIVRDTHRVYSLASRYVPGSVFSSRVHLYSSPSDDASERSDGQGVELVGRIVSVLPADINVGNAVRSRYSNRLGKMSYQLDYEIHVIFGNKGDNLTFRTMVNGQIHGTAHLEFGTVS